MPDLPSILLITTSGSQHKQWKKMQTITKTIIKRKDYNKGDRRKKKAERKKKEKLRKERVGKT